MVIFGSLIDPVDMKTTRQRILEYLEIKHVAASLDFSRALHVTTANIRHHLSVLLQEGVIEVVGARAAGNRGRPSRLYALSRHITAHNLDNLVDILLQELTESASPQEQYTFLAKVARRLAKTSRPEGKNLTQRFYQAIQKLSEMNYQARWEARPKTPLVIFNHCPYAAVLHKHPELCQMDIFLLENLLGSSVTQIARRERTNQGVSHCIFKVGELILLSSFIYQIFIFFTNNML